MGQKQAKGFGESIWSADEGDVMDYGCASNLTRSTQQDRAQNALGLPDDVLCHIASLLSVEDIACAARTCKTWRRIVYKDVVWRSVAARSRHIQLSEDGGDVRLQVIQQWETYVEDGFSMIPFTVTNLSWVAPVAAAGNDYCDVCIVVVSPSFDPDPLGHGKTSLLSVFMAGHSLLFKQNAQLPRSECETFRKGVHMHHIGLSHVNKSVQMYQVDMIEVASCRSIMDPMFKCTFEKTDVIMIVDTFHRPGRHTALNHLVEHELAQAFGRKDVPVVVVRSKADLRQPFYDKLAVLKWCRQRKYPFLSVSAKDEVKQVDRAIHLAVRMGLHFKASSKNRIH